ncbi:TPA: lipopolysaccharide heptosyltransferase family protein, partial [Campylobacter fetus]|nr:lipopolysaccharide heptosyltransferase family protein [Campylobacter fetus]
LLILSFFRKKTDKILIIQTAKIGDYANSTIIFGEASSTKGGKFDIVLDEININFANYDSRIENKFIINRYKKGVKKFILGFKLFFKSYDKIYVLMPNNLNLFLAKFAFSNHIITISHYKNSSLFYLLSKNAKVIHHTKEDLTLKTYLKMLDLELFQNELQKDMIKVKKMVQKP